MSREILIARADGTIDPIPFDSDSSPPPVITLLDWPSPPKLTWGAPPAAARLRHFERQVIRRGDWSWDVWVEEGADMVLVLRRMKLHIALLEMGEFFRDEAESRKRQHELLVRGLHELAERRKP